MTNIKVEDHEELPFDNMCPRQMGDNGASSSGSHIRSSFIGMGFSPSLVDKAIEENGEDNEELLLETLFKYSALQNMKPESSYSLGGLLSDKDELAAVPQPRDKAPRKSCSESSDSFDSLFGEKNDTSSHANFAADINLKEEPDVSSGVNSEKKASLLMMNFSVDEVEFAIDKLGEDAPISELVDFIFAAQIAENTEKDVDCPNYCDEGMNEDSNTETLFGTMNKTLRLLEMGFSEQEISAAIEKYGSDVSVAELADSIVSGLTVGTCGDEYSSKPVNKLRSLGGVMRQGLHHNCFDDLTVKTEEFSPESVSQFPNVGLLEKYKGKRPKEEYIDEHISLKRPKEEYDDALTSVCPTWLGARHGISKITNPRKPVSQRQRQNRAHPLDGDVPTLAKPNSCRSLDRMVAKPPYFFYGNVMNLSHDSWVKISQFLYAIEPEFVNIQFFSALSRKEGYVHNLPTDNRFHIKPKSPLTIEEAVPDTKKWWPSWDTRKQLSCINADTSGISQQCDRLERILVDSRGLLSVEQQRDLLHRCRSFNLVWVGRNKLKPIEPEHVERILGYPVHHTRVAGFSLTERLHSLKHCFQIDSLGYHVSALKSLFPGGLTLLSIYSGIGGSEITLHRLGIRLKGVVSVEPCETKRKILKQWWSSSGQSGELMQIEDIQKLSSSKIEILMKKFGGFDFIICQNPYNFSLKFPSMSEDSDSFAGLDFSLFYEFVRILQRVRCMMGNSR